MFQYRANPPCRKNDQHITKASCLLFSFLFSCAGMIVRLLLHSETPTIYLAIKIASFIPETLLYRAVVIA